MNPKRLAGAYLAEACYETLRMLRAPGFAIPFLLLPVALYLLFGVLIYGDALSRDPKSALFTFVAFSVLGVLGPGMFGFGVVIAIEREHGLYRLKRALPMPPAASLLSKMLMAMLFVALVMLSMTAAAPLGHCPLGTGQIVRFSLVNVAGALPFCALGLFIGTLVGGKSAPAIVNLIYLPMIYLSGFLFQLPKSVGWIAQFSPAYYLHQLTLRSIGSPSAGSAWMNFGVLAAVTLLLTAVSVRRLARVG